MSARPDLLSRPIVVGVSRDRRSDAAVAVALELSRRYELPVEFVHGVANSRDLDVATKLLGTHLDALDREGRPSSHLSVVDGRAARVLVERARMRGAGLIVLGPHRRRGLLDLGRTARTVLTHAPCPVWCQFETPRPLRHLLVPVDMSDEGQVALDAGLRLAATVGARVTLQHVFIGPAFAYAQIGQGAMPTYVVDQVRDQTHADFEKFVEAIDWGDIEHDSVFVEGEPAASILESQEDIDLIVMACHGRGALSSAVLGSVTNAVLREASAPVLAVPPTASHAAE